MTATAWGTVSKTAARPAETSRWTEARLAREIRAAVEGVVKSAGCSIRSMDIDVITPPERAEATAKAAEYGRLAATVTDPAQRAVYEQLAKAERRKAGQR